MSRTYLTGADMRRVNLNRTNLAGAIMAGANLEGAAWCRTICPNGKLNVGINPCWVCSLVLLSALIRTSQRVVARSENVIWFSNSL